MSFSSDVKLEIIANKPMWKHNKNALAYGLFFHCQNFNLKEISLTTGQKDVAEQFKRLVCDLLKENSNIKFSEKSTNDTSYYVKITNKSDRVKLIEYFENIEVDFLASEEDKFIYLAGAFLACGYVTDPQKSYQLEFVTPRKEVGEKLIELCGGSLPRLRTMMRRNKMVVYCKDSTNIIDALTMMGASNATLKVIDVEMMKNLRNTVNRATNCETANIYKTINAATSQIEDIKLVMEVIGKDNLSEPLVETAKMRLEYPYSSLRELAELFNPPLTRSGIHHRLSSLSKIADEIRKKEVGNV